MRISCVSYCLPSSLIALLCVVVTDYGLFNGSVTCSFFFYLGVGLIMGFQVLVSVLYG